jgi:hypothetical protein
MRFFVCILDRVQEAAQRLPCPSAYPSIMIWACLTGWYPHSPLALLLGSRFAVPGFWFWCIMGAIFSPSLVRDTDPFIKQALTPVYEHGLIHPCCSPLQWGSPGAGANEPFIETLQATLTLYLIPWTKSWLTDIPGWQFLYFLALGSDSPYYWSISRFGQISDLLLDWSMLIIVDLQLPPGL